MNVVLCETSAKEKYNAAKARRDALKIVKQAGYRHIVLFHNGYWKPYIMCELIFACIKTICFAGKNDKVFIQYPYYPSFVNMLFFSLLSLGKRVKKYTIIMLIHDVPSLRQRISHRDENLEQLSHEVKAWSWMDHVICHNEKMLAILKKAYPFDKYNVLGLFDYLYDGTVCERAYRQPATVMVAGNLTREKSGYIYQLNSVANIKFDLFGTGYTGEESENIKYRGKFLPEELISHLDGQFGLVWDGDSPDECSGDTGEYLKYNNPYKFSLYLAAGVPVIVWKESALAEYVEKNKIGIVIQSLRELKSKFDDIDKIKYNEMVANVMKVRKAIIQGQQLKNAGI